MGAYVYGIVRAAAGERPSAAGIDGERVELVESGGLAVLVSDVDSLPVKGNRRNLMAHSQVLQEVVAERCVLPMRFGVVMPDRRAVVAELLEPHAQALAEQLETFEPYVEVDVRALCSEDDLLRAVVAERADVAALRERVAGRPEEATYYERVQLGELVAQAVGERREAVDRAVVAEVEPLAVAVERGEPMHDQMLANAAFLVERDRLGEVDRAVERLGERLAPLVALRYLGPLPPHNFVDLGAHTEERAWA